MNSEEYRNIFLKYLSQTYLVNSNSSFSYKTVYNELVRYYIHDNNVSFIDGESLVGIQVKLSNRYRKNKNIEISGDDSHWKIYNKGGRGENEYLHDMYNSIKLYISVDSKDLYKVSSLLFDYMINEGIVMHSKVANVMRTDVLVCRVKNVEDAMKVSNYVNSIEYNPVVRINPFVYSFGNVGIVMDGRLSYNNVLSRLICEYLKYKKESNDLDNVSSEDLAIFIEKQIILLKSDDKEKYINLYEIESNDKYKDFIMVCSIISRNLNNDMDIDILAEYKNYKDVFLDDLEFISFDSDEVKMKYVIYSMGTYYSVHEVHERIMKFIDTGDYTLFTRTGEKNIRAIMYNNFTPSDTLEIISRIGWKALINVSKITYDKNGEEQLFTAVKELFNDEGLTSFSNDDYARSRLGLVIPPELLKKVIVSKLEENSMNISTISLTQLILEEINKLDNKKKHGRK